MDEKQIIDHLHLYLNQIALELEEAAGASRNAARCLSDHHAAWVQVQQLFARLSQANHLINRLKGEIEEAYRTLDRSV